MDEQQRKRYLKRNYDRFLEEDIILLPKEDINKFIKENNKPNYLKSSLILISIMLVIGLILGMGYSLVNNNKFKSEIFCSNMNVTCEATDCVECPDCNCPDNVCDVNCNFPDELDIKMEVNESNNQ